MSEKTTNDAVLSKMPKPVQVIKPFQRFFKKIVSGSFPLFFTALLALIWANLSAASYHHVWHSELTLSLGHLQITKSLIHWIDEALITLFFFTVGLEIKREVHSMGVSSHLHSVSRGACCGQFSLDSVAPCLRVFGHWHLVCHPRSGIHATVAGIVVAAFIPAKGKYDTDTFITTCKAHLERFKCEPGSCGYSILLNPAHLNAIHDIQLACLDVETPLQRLEYSLHPWVSFMILPLFALANTGLNLDGLNITGTIAHPVTLGILLGLVLGKPIGISLFTYVAFKTLKVRLPSGVNWLHIIGAGILGGIGFTMSLFISGLSFSSTDFIELSKLGIILGSLVSGVLGIVVLSLGGISKSRPPAH